MKRSRSHENGPPVIPVIYEDDYGALFDHDSGLLTPPPEEMSRPSKMLRHGSKLMSVLRSLTNSGGMYFIPRSCPEKGDIE
jgi:hypothetical protein